MATWETGKEVSAKEINRQLHADYVNHVKQPGDIVHDHSGNIIGIAIDDNHIMIRGTITVTPPKTRWYNRLWNRIRGKSTDTPYYTDN